MLTDRLRVDTQVIHSLVEQSAWAQQLMRGPSPEEYCWILQRWHALYSAYRTVATLPQLSTLLEAGIDRLVRDLAGCGPPQSSDRVPVDCCDEATELRSLGAIYVLGGSALGGRVISRCLGQSASEIVRNNRRFFSGERLSAAAQGGLEHWYELKEMLNRLRLSENEYLEVKEAASRVFRTIIQAFDVSSVDPCRSCSGSSLRSE